ncbi:hypothetical protein SDC9_189121 [bioreactor metagenome]|uniref:Uncharacterized protein n=1 Tax=bioreactor metagenome TaxID=1076179 RepID=A0A645HR84_9ZZZZ
MCFSQILNDCTELTDLFADIAAHALREINISLIVFNTDSRASETHTHFAGCAFFSVNF